MLMADIHPVFTEYQLVLVDQMAQVVRVTLVKHLIRAMKWIRRMSTHSWLSLVVLTSCEYMITMTRWVWMNLFRISVVMWCWLFFFF
jgi:hypothetical protein